MTETGNKSEIFDDHVHEYGHKPVCTVSSPGLLSLLGEHTIFFKGSSIVIPLSLRCYVAVSLRQDDIFRFFAVDLDERKKHAANSLKFRKEDRWSNCVKGAIVALIQEGCIIRGANFTIRCDIPDISGFLSTSSIILACLSALCGAVGFRAHETKLAELASWIEKHYLEGESSRMGFQALFKAKRNKFMIFDAASDTVSVHSFGAHRFTMLLINSRVSTAGHERELLTGLEDSQKCLKMLSDDKHGADLRNLSVKDMEDARGIIPEFLRRKGAFLIDEMHRVKSFTDAFAHKNPSNAWKAIRKSHEGLRDMLEISCPEVDWIVKRSEETDGVFASRIIGKGFGGYVITFLSKDRIPDFLSHLEEYERIFGFKPLSREVGTDDGIVVL